MKYRALKIFSDPNSKTKSSAKLVELDLDSLTPQENEILIKVEFSSVNYKDALAVTGKGKILKVFPLVPGIDLAGEVYHSSNQDFKTGEKVFINGCGLGESINGGFSQYACVPTSMVMHTPSGLTNKEAMSLGTAGFTAALCLKRMETNGQTPEMGPIVITGASGGVGSSAIQIFNNCGYETIAISSKRDSYEKLNFFGATKIIHPQDLKLGTRPLEKSRWAGAVDNVGGDLLEGIMRHTKLWGNIASVGLADSAKFNTTVMPMILRGVSVLGISSANCPMPLRKEIWKLLGNSWKPKHLEQIINSEISLSEISSYSNELLDRKKQGRALVNLQI